MSAYDFSGNIERFTGFARQYDDHRPSPPSILGDLLASLVQVDRPELVVDLGCGTGLSTRYWADKAQKVIGIEPTASMREQAQSLPLPNVSYREGYSHATGLPAHCANIITAAQSLHWMDPEGTFAEVKRILVPGGVFASCDYDWPPVTGNWRVDQAYETCVARCRELETAHGIDEKVRRWDKSSHLLRMQECGQFRYAREIVVHHIDLGNDSRLLGLIGSQGHVSSLRKLGLSDDELGITRLQEVATSNLGSEMRTWTWSSRIRVAIV